MVTGGTTGLGLRLAEVLARDGVDVLLTGRSAAAAREAAQGVGARGAALDLGSLASVAAFAAHVAEHTGGRPLHALVCNAGIQVTRRTSSADGMEATFGVNHVGHVALVEDLLRLTGPPRRMVLVSSGTHDPALRTGMPAALEQAPAAELAFPPPLNEPEARDSRRRYTTSKLANTRTAFELARRLEGRTQVFAFDPGLMPGTGLARDATRLQRALWHTVARALLVLPGVQTPARSAQQLARLVLDPTVTGTGTYEVQGRTGQASVAARDEDAQRRLYEDTLALIAAARR